MQRWVKAPPIEGVNRALPETGVRYWDGGESWSMSRMLLKSNDTERVFPDSEYSLLVQTTGIIAGPFRLSFEGQPDMLLVVRQDSEDLRSIIDVYNTAGSLLKRHSVSGVATSATVVHNKGEYYLGMGEGVDNLLIYYDGAVLFKQLGMDSELRDVENLFVSVFPTSSDQSVFTDGDVVVYFVTEYDEDRDVESLPVTVFSVPNVTGGEFETYSGVEGSTALPAFVSFTVSLPPLNSRATKLRVYRHFLGNYKTGSVTTSDVQAFYDYESFQGGLLLESDGVTAPDGVLSDPLESIQDPAVSYPQTVIGQDFGLALFATPIKPRSFDVATVFNDSVVTNDPATSSEVLRYTPPGLPEYQPNPYFIYFATDRNDTIVGLEQVNGVLVVLLRGGVFRVNYLPTSDDFSSLRGRVQQVLTKTFGCVGKRAYTRVDTARGSYVVWLSERGLEFTAGDGVDDLCPDFRTELLTGAVSTSVLINNERLQRVELYNDGLRWDFYYHPSHVKEGRLKLVGPHAVGRTIRGGSSGPTALYGASFTDVVSDGASYQGESEWVLGRFVNTANPFGDVEVTGVAFYATGAGQAAVEIRAADTGDAATATAQTRTLDWSEPGLQKMEFGARGKIARVQITISGQDWSAGPFWYRMDFSEADAT